MNDRFDKYPYGGETKAPRAADEMRGREAYEPRRETHGNKRWYNQRWPLVVALLVGFGILAFALSGVAQQVAGVSDSIREQTAVMEEQAGIWGEMRTALGDLTEAVRFGFDRLTDEIRNAAEQMNGSG